VFFGNLLNAETDLNRSMSDSPCAQQLTIESQPLVVVMDHYWIPEGLPETPALLQ